MKPGTTCYNNGHEHFLLCAFTISVFISIIKVTLGHLQVFFIDFSNYFLHRKIPASFVI